MGSKLHPVALFAENYFFYSVKHNCSFGHGVDGEDMGLVFIHPVVVLYIFGSQFFVEKFGIGVENVVRAGYYRDFPQLRVVAVQGAYVRAFRVAVACVGSHFTGKVGLC